MNTNATVNRKHKKNKTKSCKRTNENRKRKSKINKNTYVSNKFKFKLMFIENTDFRDLENIVKKCDELICCEGAISHVSNSFKKKTYALTNDLKIGNFWTKHMKYLKLIKRKNNINNMCKQIISLNK